MGPIRLQMPKEMFTPAEFKRYEEDASIEFIKAGPDLYEFTGPVHWQADITNTGGALLVTGMVEGEVKCSCARCLEEMSFPITGEIEGYYIINPEDAAPDEMEEDEFDVLPEDKTIDMAPLIQAAILLELPNVPVCSDDCKGLCHKCGANLNEGDCGCTSEDKEIPAENPFSVLKNFDFGE